MDVKVTPTAKKYLIDEGYDKAMGARPLRRVIEREIRDKVTDYYLDHLDVKHLVAEMQDGKLVIVDAKDAAKDDSDQYTPKADEDKDDKKEEK
jgi:ATP-dependent Clp protease ATP-binding subunit ClpL